MRASTALARSIGLRDLQGRLVLPRLLYAIAIHTVDRAARRLSAVLLLQPAGWISEFFRTLDEHERKSEIAFAGIHALVALLQALALLLLAVAALVLALSRL